MNASQSTPARWVLNISALFSTLEIIVSIVLFVSPESALETVDMNAKGVDYVIYMWGVRQFALGVILAIATNKRSIPMLTVCFVFLVTMFIGDVVIGILFKEIPLIISALFMSVISAALLFGVNRRK